MTLRDELLAAVPLRDHNGKPYYVDLADIPQPWRDQFLAALRGSQIPVIEGVERAAYAWDWQQWVNRLTLDDLLAIQGSEPLAIDREWDAMPAVGREKPL